MGKLIFILKMSINWWKRKRGFTIVDYVWGCGYYMSHNILPGSVRTQKMESGKSMRMRLINYSTYNDPHDMIKESSWQYLGYIGEIPFAELTLKQYLKMCLDNWKDSKAGNGG